MNEQIEFNVEDYIFVDVSGEVWIKDKNNTVFVKRSKIKTICSGEEKNCWKIKILGNILTNCVQLSFDKEPIGIIEQLLKWQLKVECVSEKTFTKEEIKKKILKTLYYFCDKREEKLIFSFNEVIKCFIKEFDL